MEKYITIKEINGVQTFHAEGFSEMELLGTLRYHEKQLWLNMVENSKKKSNQENKNVN